MKFEKIIIKNFRKFNNREINFKTEDGQLRDLTLLLGPNGSGKTSILDAITLGLARTMRLPLVREGIRMEFEHIVHKGALQCKVDYDVLLDKDEFEALRFFERQFRPDSPHPRAPHGKVRWTFPTPEGQPDLEGEWTLLKGRSYFWKLWKERDISDFKQIDRVGGVFYFDQERNITPRIIRHIEAPKIEPYGEEDITLSQLEEDEKAFVRELKRSRDLKDIIVDYAIKAKLRDTHDVKPYFDEIRERFNDICAPRTMVDLIRRGNEEYNIEFQDGENNTYYFDSLSSGEYQILLFITEFVTKRINRSIILIDELDLHLHPTWQREMLKALLKMGKDNQFIITTHSPFLAEVVPSDAIIELGPILKDIQNPVPV